jgi:hypothetical protein
MLTKERETLKRSRLNKVAILFGGAVIILFAFCLAGFDQSGNIQVLFQRKWEFTVRHLRGGGADTFHWEARVLCVGPLEFYYNYNVSDGPVAHIQTIAVGKQKEVEIFAQRIDTNERKSTVLLYCFREPQRRFSWGTYSFGTLDGTTNGLQFDVISNQDGDLVGVTERSRPTVVLILRDFSLGFDWPGTPLGKPEYWKADERTAESLIAELAKDNQLRNLELGSSWRTKGIAVLRKQFTASPYGQVRPGKGMSSRGGNPPE